MSKLTDEMISKDNDAYYEIVRLGHKPQGRDSKNQVCVFTSSGVLIQGIDYSDCLNKINMDVGVIKE